MADVHIIGEIEGAKGFNTQNLFLTYEFLTGTQWLRVAGDDVGQTHTIDKEETTPFAHPIDVHYRANAMDGWPRIIVHVWSLDRYGRRDLQGYGSAYLSMPASLSSVITSDASSTTPSTSANVSVTECFLEISTWQPRAPTLLGQLRSMLLGGTPLLKEPSVIADADERYKLHAISRGIITARLYVAVRGTLTHDGGV